MLPTRSSNKGVSVIEILIVIFILSSVLASLLGLINLSLGVSGLVSQNLRASALAQEAMESQRSIRDNAGWSQIIIGSASENIDIFTRTILTESVFRDVNDNIAASGGVIDPDTKKITATVAWQERDRSHSVKLVTYLTNWQQ
jgi:type II secretory pathway pseudopilin PulG